jgi:hypothetical protein
MQAEHDIAALARVVQLAIAPVFLLTGVVCYSPRCLTGLGRSRAQTNRRR